MPELPEIETTRRSLEGYLAGQRIVGVRVSIAKMLKGAATAPDEFERILVGKKLISVGRRGKHLIFVLDSGYHLLLHLKMRGQLLIVEPNAPDAAYFAMGFAWDNDRELRFHDIWTWGEARIVSKEEMVHHPALAGMGLEPLSEEFTPEAFQLSLNRRQRSSIKSALLDQSVVAGVGNIYADESLFKAGLHPTCLIGSLSHEQILQLHGELQCVLRAAVELGGTDGDYVDPDGRRGRYVPMVYDRAGQACLRCGATLIRTKVAGRGTSFCSTCQAES